MLKNCKNGDKDTIERQKNEHLMKHDKIQMVKYGVYTSTEEEFKSACDARDRKNTNKIVKITKRNHSSEKMNKLLHWSFHRMTKEK